MLMFRMNQLITVTRSDSILYGQQGVVKLIELDDSAWVQMNIKTRRLVERIQKSSKHKMRGSCILLWPDDCNPVEDTGELHEEVVTE